MDPVGHQGWRGGDGRRPGLSGEAPIRDSVEDVKVTLAIAIALVVLVIFLFLRSAAATVIPALAAAGPQLPLPPRIPRRRDDGAPEASFVLYPESDIATGFFAPSAISSFCSST
jgi:hypothetical protein